MLSISYLNSMQSGRKYANRIDCICKQCNKPFKVLESRFKRMKIMYCSSGCSKLNMAGSNNPNWKGGLTKCKCLCCSKEFEAKVKTIKNGGGKYCSYKCSRKLNHLERSKRALEKRIKKPCLICQKEMILKPSHANRIVYCSIGCMSLSYSKRLIGKNNPNYKNAGYENYSKTSIKQKQLRKNANKIKNHTPKEWNDLKTMYNNKCACCNKSGLKLTKDHIIPITKGGDSGIDNIQPLCHKCNVKKFTKIIRYEVQLQMAI